MMVKLTYLIIAKRPYLPLIRRIISKNRVENLKHYEVITQALMDTSKLDKESANLKKKVK